MQNKRKNINKQIYLSITHFKYKKLWKMGARFRS